MEQKGKLKSYLIIVAGLMTGIIILGITGLFNFPDWLNSSVVILLLFVLVNGMAVKILRLTDEARTFWSLKKVIYLPVGFAVGGLIAVSPALTGVVAGQLTLSDVSLKTDMTIAAIVSTLVIVSWEELWFRGIYLNYCRRYLSPIVISVVMGLLFMSVHILNPEIDLLKTGPALFFAGAFLTSVYFCYRTIWLPIGVHFGNNLLTLATPVEKHWLLGNEGYLSTCIMVLLFFLFVKPAMSEQRSESNK